MSKIPFSFDRPTPTYFREMGWFKNPNMCAFVTWAFSRCYPYEREITHDGKKIVLKPYQFIFGREKCVAETGLTDRQVRTCQQNFEKASILKKSTNKTPNRFTIYEWVTEVFLDNSDQQNAQQATNKRPTNDHNIEGRRKKEKKGSFLSSMESGEEAGAAASFLFQSLCELGLSNAEDKSPVKLADVKRWLKLYEPAVILEAARSAKKLAKKGFAPYIQGILSPKKKEPLGSREWVEKTIKQNAFTHFDFEEFSFYDRLLKEYHEYKQPKSDLTAILQTSFEYALQEINK